MITVMYAMDHTHGAVEKVVVYLLCLEAKKVTRVLSVADLMLLLQCLSARSWHDNVSTSTSYVRTVAVSASEKRRIRKYVETIN
jgi:hypothetical protein